MPIVRRERSKRLRPGRGLRQHGKRLLSGQRRKRLKRLARHKQAESEDQSLPGTSVRRMACLAVTCLRPLQLCPGRHPNTVSHPRLRRPQHVHIRRYGDEGRRPTEAEKNSCKMICVSV